MATPRKVGSVLPQRQHIVYDFDPYSGNVRRELWEGISQSRMIALRDDYVRNGVACRLSLYEDMGELETDDSTQQYVLDTWQLLGNSERLSIWHHPTIKSQLTDDQMAKILEYLNDDAGPATAFADSVLSGASAQVKRFYALALRGSEEYENDAYAGGYVLRHTTNAPNVWGLNIADFGVGRIYTMAQLLSEARSSALWILPLPLRLAYKIANLPGGGGALAASAPTATNYQWGWKKSRSTEVYAANNRIDIATEYILELWSTDLYSPY